MLVIPADVPDVLLVEPTVHRDARGSFLETWSAPRFTAHGLDATFVQDNLSCSARGVIRGLHAQHPDDQAKLVTVVSGRAFDVAVDVRRDSPTFGRWVGVELSASNARQLWIPAGFAHGFLALEDDTRVLYKATAAYRPASELAVRWNDPAIAIAWPLEGRVPIVSPRDVAAPLLADVPPSRLPLWRAHVEACALAQPVRT
jgi:dTDP-4-dehydrorhamnose 3,5-epimerase